MTAKDPDPLELAASLTEQIAVGVPSGPDDLNQIWDAGDDALRQLTAAGYSPAEFLPDDEASELNFTVPGADFARRFYRAYAREVRKSLCGADGDLRVNIQASGLGVAVGDRWLRFGGVRGVAVVAERGFGDDSGL